MDAPVQDQQENPAVEEIQEEKSFFGIIIHSFFVVPFLIAVFCILLFVAVRLLTIEQHTVYDYLNDVKTGGLTKRWQSAFELSKLVLVSDKTLKDERFISELISAFDHAQGDDNRVRQYLALAMGRTGDARFVKPLVGALKDEKEENLYALIYALGMLKDKNSAEQLHGFVDHPNSRIRLITVMALGNLGNENSVKILKESLSDLEANVQWDSAIALAKMKDSSGRDLLLKLLDRNYLASFSEIDQQEKTHILLVAIEAGSRLEDSEINNAILNLASNDQNMKVRQAAMILKKN